MLAAVGDAFTIIMEVFRPIAAVLVVAASFVGLYPCVMGLCQYQRRRTIIFQRLLTDYISLHCRVRPTLESRLVNST